MRKPAFTLLELLIVITLIGVLTAILVVDVNASRFRQQLSLLADQSLAMLQQSRAEVKAGKVKEESYLCEGLYLKEGEASLLAVGHYEVEAETCSSFQTEPYGLSTGEAAVASVEVGGVRVDSLWVIYTPPHGQVLFLNDAGDLYSGDLLVSFAHPSVSGFTVQLYLSSQTGLARLLLPSFDSADED